MPNITEELQELKKASQAQTSASQQLADEVSQKMGAIDKKTNDSILMQNSEENHGQPSPHENLENPPHAKM